jgi:aspartate aminotransferase
MMERISERIKSMAESETLAMARLSRELKEKGIDIINLSLGEPDFNTPEFIKQSAIKAINDNYSYYTPVQGYKDLLEAIVEKFKRDNNIEYTTDEIVVSTGAKQSLANIIYATINEGDEVIVPIPYWVTYDAQIKLAGGIPKFIKSGVEQNFKISPEQLEAAITPKSKMLLFSTPCNPSGVVYSKEELESIAVVLRKYPHILVVSDEIYEYINFTGKTISIASLPEMKERTVTVNGLSKAFAMTGWRLGYIGAPKDIAAACTKLQGQITSATNSITQRAAITALKSGIESIQFMIDAFAKRKDLIYGLLKEIPGIVVNEPEAAFYAFPDVSAYFGKSFQNYIINDSQDLSMYLINEAFVAATPGAAFGSPECLRISYAASEESIKEAIKRIANVLQKLK